jgi:hypothetical protein
VAALETAFSQLSASSQQNNSASLTLDSIGTNLLRNSSFEQDDGSGKPRQWNYQLDSTTGNTYKSAEGIHSGSYGLKFQGGGTGNFGISQPTSKTVPGRTYTFSTYIKAVNVKNVTVRLGFWNEYANTRGTMKNFTFSGTKDWTRITMTATTSGIITDTSNWFPLIEILGLTQGNIYLDDAMLGEGSVLADYNSALAQSSTGGLGDGAINASTNGDLTPAVNGVGNLGVSGDAWASLTLSSASIDNNGNLSLNGGATIGGAETITGNLTEKSNASITGTLGVTGATTLSSTLSVASGTTVGSTYAGVTAPTNGLAVVGNVGIGTSSPGFKLELAGTSHFTGAATLDSTLFVGGTATFNSVASSAGTSLCISSSNQIVSCAT